MSERTVPGKSMRLPTLLQEDPLSGAKAAMTKDPTAGRPADRLPTGALPAPPIGSSASIIELRRRHLGEAETLAVAAAPSPGPRYSVRGLLRSTQARTSHRPLPGEQRPQDSTGSRQPSE
ncbi:MAG: hypothetical protein M3198_04375 [Actinomycetota bacterium]|nr:hypothetical protein [Actinomycetota bacterium]